MNTELATKPYPKGNLPTVGPDPPMNPAEAFLAPKQLLAAHDYAEAVLDGLIQDVLSDAKMLHPEVSMEGVDWELPQVMV